MYISIFSSLLLYLRSYTDLAPDKSGRSVFYTTVFLLNNQSSISITMVQSLMDLATFAIISITIKFESLPIPTCIKNHLEDAVFRDQVRDYAERALWLTSIKSFRDYCVQTRGLQSNEKVMRNSPAGDVLSLIKYVGMYCFYNRYKISDNSDILDVILADRHAYAHFLYCVFGDCSPPQNVKYNLITWEDAVLVFHPTQEDQFVPGQVDNEEQKLAEFKDLLTEERKTWRQTLIMKNMSAGMLNRPMDQWPVKSFHHKKVE